MAQKTAGTSTKTVLNHKKNRRRAVKKKRPMQCKQTFFTNGKCR